MSLVTERQNLPRDRWTERPLKIGMIAPPWFEIPPRAYGGIEAVVASLVDQLVLRGHEITLIAAGAPGTKAQHYVRVYKEAPSQLLGASVMPELVQAARAAQVLERLDLDLVHDHSAAGPLLARGRTLPTVVTMHGPVASDSGAYFECLDSSVDIVAISAAQRRQAPLLNWVGTVHNAIDVASFPFEERKSDVALWIGRFSPNKGAHLAIMAARRAGRRIILAGKLNEAAEREYFDEEVRPLLGPDAEYVGEADAALKRELFAMASCLLFPISWEEPFGMVMAEALACGTPVVATPHGSVPEIIRHGRTGFITDGLENLAAAIARVSEIDPRACRRDAEERFDLPIMAAGYERIYQTLTSGHRSIRAITTRRAG